MPPTMHESTKHPQRGRRPVSIDQFPKINGSGIPDSLPFHKKYVARPQKSFRIDPFFKRGRRVQGGNPAKIVRKGATTGAHRPAPENQRFRHSGFLTLPLKVCCLSAEKVFGSTPFSKGVAGVQGGSPAKSVRKGVAERRTLKRESGYKEGTLQETPIVRLQALRKCSISFKSIRSWAFSASPPCCLP